VRRAPLLIIAILIAIGFLVYMTTFTVRFTDVAVVSTFGRVGEGDVVTEPGLKFKWPAPIQSTTVYDRRARFLQARSETQSTADERQIIVESFVTWRVSDPLVFYQKFRGTAGSDTREHYRRAEEILTSQLRSAMSEVSRYRLNELFTPEAGRSRLPQLEKDIHARLSRPETQGGGNIDQYGVEVMLVGINSVVLPEQTTSAVFEAMKAARQRLASVAQEEGNAAAERIRSEATTGADTIRNFVQTLAARIESQGDVEAGRWLKMQSEDPELAEFLKKIDFLRQGIGKRLTLILPTSMWGLDLLAPGALERLQNPSASPTSGSPTSALPEPGPSAAADASHVESNR